MGWIGRRGPMPEAFTSTIFALDSGELSKPVKTSFGVHLVKVLKVEQGKIGWRDARQELRAAVTQFLFAWIVDNKADGIAVEYTGAIEATMDPGENQGTSKQIPD